MTDDNNDDLFDCFGSEDDEEDEDEDEDEDENQVVSILQVSSKHHDKDGHVDEHKHKQLLRLRDPDCGVCKQLNAERSLLMHVKNAISRARSTCTSSNTHSSTRNNSNADADADLVLATIDDYCQKRAWMMHLGPEKSSIIQNVLREKLDEFIIASCQACEYSCDRNGRTNTPIDTDTDTSTTLESVKGQRRSFVCVELGTYCGYGSVQISKVLSEYAKNRVQGNDGSVSDTDIDIDFHLFTVEINPTYAQIAKEVIDMSQLSDHVTILQNELMMNGLADDVGLLLKEGIIRQHQGRLQHCETNTEKVDVNPDKGEAETNGEVDDVCIDFLLIDHDKDSYLDDLLQLERCGLVRKGTVVAADNVIFAQIDDYVKYMKDLDRRGVVSSETIHSLVEYSAPDISHNGNNEEMYRDGIEISKYVNNPIV